MSRRSRGRILAGSLPAATLMAVALLPGCEPAPSGPPAASQTSGAAGSGGAGSPVPTGDNSAAAVPGARPYTTESPPPGPAGRLAGWTAPAGSVAYSFSLWYSGVSLGPSRAGLVVAYPAIEVSSTGGRTVAHLKVPVFRCASRFAPRSPNYGGCTDRQVEYGDLATPALRVSGDAAGRITVVGRFPTYVYGAEVDRDFRLPTRWTGRTYLVRIEAVPAAPLPNGTRTYRAVGTVTLGSGSAAVAAGADLGYPNRFVTGARR